MHFVHFITVCIPMKCSLGLDNAENQYLRPPMNGEVFALSTSLLFVGDMTLVSYLRKSLSIREDDSRSPHSPPHYVNTTG